MPSHVVLTLLLVFQAAMHMGAAASNGEPYSLVGESVQVVSHSWSPDELLARRVEAGAPVWAEGNELTFVYRGEADAVRVCCGIQLPMRRIPGSDVWVLTVRVQDLQEAVISYAFMAERNGVIVGPPEFQVWRGPQAPSPVRGMTRTMLVFDGQIERYELESRALDERRGLTVYLPPGHDPATTWPVIYAADGQSVPMFASVLEPLILEGVVPPLLLVGVHSATGRTAGGSPDARALEYLPGFDAARFEAHERFFVNEVAVWAERELGASSRREDRAVFGYSNGGVFAAAMGLRHAGRYGHVLAFSLGMPPEQFDQLADLAPAFYLVAGTLESGFHNATARFANSLQWWGIDHVFRSRVSGHDFVMWRESFPAAVRWAFGSEP